jgi:hypothetical protein
VTYRGFESTGLGGLIPRDFDGDGILDPRDADQIRQAILGGLNEPRFDLNRDGIVNDQDLRVWIKDLAHSWVGDANVDGVFDSSDLVRLFQAGKFERDVDAIFSEGDWNGDGRFDTSDLVAAFQDGGYERGRRV